LLFSLDFSTILEPKCQEKVQLLVRKSLRPQGCSEEIAAGIGGFQKRRMTLNAAIVAARPPQRLCGLLSPVFF
jgi:hypothetical protein